MKPIVATWESSRKCNFRCLHCYNNSSEVGYELSKSKALEMIDKIYEFEIETMINSGGEPLLRRDISDITSYSRERFNKLILQTNGSLIPIIDNKVLKQYDEVVLTVFGRNDIDAYFKQCNNPNIEGALEILTNHGIPFSLSTVLTTLNKNEFEYLYQMAKAIGAKSLMVQKLLPFGRAKLNKFLTLNPREEDELINKIANLDREFIVIGHNQRCGGGDVFVEIDCYGNVSPCAFLESKENIFEKSLFEIVNYSKLFNDFLSEKNRDKECVILKREKNKKS